jgi:hypothetical protein
MPDILINPVSKLELDSFIEKRNHALGLVGDKGFGKRAVINWMLVQYLGDLPSKIENYPYLKELLDNEGSIIIDSIRELRSFLKLRIPGDSGLRRFVIIDHADNLTLEAQNALLKTLEDPPSDTLMILSLNNELSVLPTIRSRLQLIHLKRPARSDIINFFGQRGYSNTDIERAYLMSGGLVGLMNVFLDEEDSSALSVVEDAKQLLRSSQFERLNKIDTIYKDKAHCQMLVKMLIQIGQSGLETTADRKDERSMIRWQRVINACYRAELAFSNNAQSKLVLTDLMLNL